MEMGSVELDHEEECMEETYAYRLLSPASSDISGIHGEPQIPPRVGNQYQVDIPPLTTELEHLRLIHYPTDIEQMVDSENSIQIGLPIPVMWILGVIDQMKHEQMEFVRNLTNVDAPQSVGSEVVNDEVHVDFPSREQKIAALDNKSKNTNYVPVPGSLGSSWSDIEQDSFILGLYIFGKNLLQIKRFIGGKGMGDIQSFYYGKFYGSDAHHRWLDCQKMRNRKSIHGQRIFTGWRQQELLSRLLSHTSEECRNTLLEVTKAFGEAKVSLEEYVSTLKALVGVNILVEAVGVGKGKRDLTAMEPVKTNPSISARSEVPIGKACSSLTPAEIIKFLTGDFRLSKARSNDLFWEAVWPRLLARGWHSEEPKHNGYVTSKPSLVFLMPGIKKFSRRKLVKGNHYFDSVTDVLNKVASDPMLLEFDIETVHDGRKEEENAWDPNAEFDKAGPSDHQRHCYLRPRVQDSGSELMKFTIVDTSLVHGEKSHKMRELKSLPVDNAHDSMLASLSKQRDNDDSSEEEQADEPVSADTISHDQEDSYPTTSDDKKSTMLMDGLDYAISPTKQGVVEGGLDASGIQNDDCEDPFPGLLNKRHPGKSIKRQFSCRVESVRPKYLSPLLKRRRLNACNRQLSRRRTSTPSMDHQLNEEERQRQSLSLQESNTVAAEVRPSPRKVSSSSGKGSADESSGCIPSENALSISTVSGTHSHEKCQKKALIDLNIPQVPEDLETDRPFIEAEDSQDDSDTKGSSIPSETNKRHENSWATGTSNEMDSADPPIANARRQSTRNRPLTTRVLEAFECGFFNMRRRRGRKNQPHGNPIPRPRRQACHDDPGTDVMDSKVGGAEEECSSNTNMVTKSQIQAEIEGTHESFQAPRTAYQPGIFTGNDHECG